ncbi:MAG: TonB-dependent receptor [Arcicella sp.]|jgi:Fe(3+) dicitrate transport protein|nr:TonB-dependent receptor [Arcicella sp.]
MFPKLIFISIYLLSFLASSQKATISGFIKNSDNQVVIGATVSFKTSTFTSTDKNGFYKIKNVDYGKKTVVVFAIGKNLIEKEVEINQAEMVFDFTLSDLSKELDAVVVQAKREETFGISRLKSVENFGIYESKKTEVIVLKNVTANLATNNARQVFAKVAGLNIWESDGVGLQLGIGGRGLSPNRTANFNTRQNGYDISADALGYPESYYTPPIEALESIEVVRGAASLQYGTQFGGMLNFRFKKGAKDKKIELNTRQTAGSWGFLGSFNSLGGTVGKFNYYTFYQRKQGNGWRSNSRFEVNTFYGQMGYQFSEKLSANLEITFMDYLAKQAGGLTDAMFADDPRQSVRSRNWFGIDWKLASLSLNYQFSDRTKINIRNFGLLASRQSLGNLERINVDDRVVKNRTMIDGGFENIGNETRLLHRYGANNLLVGFRIYKGTTTARQGDADGGNDPKFEYLNPDNLENSDFRFPNYNYSVFAENIFTITPKWTITPGIRYEYIKTVSEGYYKQRVFDFAGNLIVDNKLTDNQSRVRDFVILGIGTSLKPNEKTEFYANISQNYRAINFTDLRINNPNFAIDPNLQDETGFSADLGIRGNLEKIFNYDVSLFLLKYNGKIGQLLKADQPPLFLDYRLRKNIADAQNVGIEAFGEVNLIKLLKKKTKNNLSIFTNVGLVDARYINTEDNSIKNKQVEMVPPVVLRTGLNFSTNSFSTSLQYSYVKQHFSDATNAIRTSTAVEGIIPSYQVLDLSAKYNFKFLQIEATCNNLLNEMYFTRRAEAYPGPGIIPSDGRAFYVTFQVKI